mgnify:CR=1 FL=1
MGNHMSCDVQESTAENETVANRNNGIKRPILELLGWAIAGVIMGITLTVTTVSALLIAAVVVLSILRMSVEAAERNPRASTWMSPVFIFGWGFGLLICSIVA